MKARGNSVSAMSNALINFVFIIYSLVCIAPFILVLSVSFTKESAITSGGYSFIPKVFSTYSYKFLFSGGEALIRSYLINIFNTVVGTLFAMLIISMFAYPLSRKDFKYRNVFSFFVFFTMIFSAGLVPWYIIYSAVLHFKNHLIVYIFPHLINAWFVIIMRTFYVTTVPDSVVESAKIDGAGEFRIFFSIIWRISLPGLATVALFTSVGIWNDWWTPLVFITNDKLYNLQYSMYSALLSAQFLQQNVDRIQNKLVEIPVQTVRMAMCITAIGPIVFAYPFFQKYFIKGLTVGAVKG